MAADDPVITVGNLSADLQRLIYGYQFTQALYVAARLAIPDLLADGPRSVVELAALSDAHAPSLARLLRALTTLDVVAEVEPDVFGLTPLGELLRSDVPESRRAWLLFTGGDQYDRWSDLLHSVRTGETTAQHLYGMSSWEWRAQHPDLNVMFNDAMVEMATRRITAVLATNDFSRFGTMVDVGGGRGALLAGILQANPGMRGVLFDLSHVVDGAEAIFKSAGIADRASVVAGDFFADVPQGGDAYILSAILHDWDDERATAILENCRRAMVQHCTLLLIERVLPTVTGFEWEPYFSDLNMMQALNGRERTEGEWRHLLDGAHFAFRRIAPTGGPISVIEAVPA